VKQIPIEQVYKATEAVLVAAVEAGKRATAGNWHAGRDDMATVVDGFDSKWVYCGEKYVAVASGQDVADWDEVMTNAYLIAIGHNLCPGLAAGALRRLRAAWRDGALDEVRRIAADCGVATEEP
jgi:hypothetical protein